MQTLRWSLFASRVVVLPRAAWAVAGLLSAAACAPNVLPEGATPSGPSGPSAPAPTFLDALLAGELTVNEALAEVTPAEAWPRPGNSGFVFVRADDGAGPYTLAGDFNGWDPEPMTAAAGFFWIEVEISAPEGQGYKFVDGDGVYAADPLARFYGYDAFGEISFVRPSGAHLERFVGIGGRGLAPRTVRVWVPAEAPTHHLYVHDGQNVFDPEAFFGGWQLAGVVGEATLVVAIDNTPARMDEYTHVQDNIGEWVGGQADAYCDLVVLDIRPWVEARFGTPERRAVMGSSLGGLVSLLATLRHPTAFDFAASLSGTVGWGSIGADNETVIERLVAAGHGTTKLYVDSGGSEGSGCVDTDADGLEDDGTGGDNYCENRQLADVLAGSGYTYDVDLWHWWEPDAPHNEAAWAARVFRPVGIFEGM